MARIILAGKKIRGRPFHVEATAAYRLCRANVIQSPRIASFRKARCCAAAAKLSFALQKGTGVLYNTPPTPQFFYKSTFNLKMLQI